MWASNLALFVGLTLIAVGLWLIYQPLTFIFLGLAAWKFAFVIDVEEEAS